MGREKVKEVPSRAAVCFMKTTGGESGSTLT